MGWDAFGSPAENDAIKKGIHPAIGTRNNIENFKRQLKEIGAMYDWSSRGQHDGSRLLQMDAMDLRADVQGRARIQDLSCP